MKDQSDKKAALNKEQGQALVRLARSTMAAKLGRPVDDATGSKILDDPMLQNRQGTFVTLHLHGSLRGCIGSLVADESVVEGVRRNASSAAFHDPRFSPLTAEELDEVDLEVSVLTEPVPMEYSNGDDLAARLRPGTDGVIIKKGRAAATFLPQVWDQLPDPASFLGHLCRKAGLSQDAWQKGDLEVSTYQVQYFSENKPGNPF